MIARLKQFLQGDSRMSRFIRNTGWLLFDRIFHMMLSLAVTGVVSRHLGVDHYGLLNYGLAFLDVFTVICKLGIDGIIVNELVRQQKSEEDKSAEILGTTIGLRLASSLLSILLIYLFVRILNPGRLVILLVTMIQTVSLLGVSLDTLDYFFQSRLESRYSVLARSISYPSVCVFRLILVWMNAETPWFGFAAVLDSMLIGFLLVFFYYRKGGAKLRFRLSMARYLLRHSWHFIAADLLVTIYTQMDRIMVQNLGNDHQMGLYSAAMLISNLWIFVPNALLDSGRPLIMEVQKGEEFESKFIRICCLIQWVCILAGAGFTCFGHIVIRIIYGEAYAGAGKALIWLIWSKLFSQMGAARSLWMLCEGTEKYIKYFVGFGAAVNLSMNAWLIPRYGAAGAAAATFFTEFLSSWAATGAWAGTRAYFRIWNRSLFYAKKLIQKRRNG